jgi:hypothetical protein
LATGGERCDVRIRDAELEEAQVSPHSDNHKDSAVFIEFVQSGERRKARKRTNEK